MNIEDVRRFYEHRMGKNRERHELLRKKIHRTGTLRLIVVLTTIILLYFFQEARLIILSGTGILGFAAYLRLVVIHNRQFREKARLETAIISDQRETQAMDYDFSAFDGFAERIRKEHPFSLDLDIFGEKSFFQAINRTCTAYGKKTLADGLGNPMLSKTAILKYQEAIRELSGKNDFCHQFIVTGLLHPGKDSDLGAIRDFMSRPACIRHRKYWKILCAAIPCLWAAAFLLSLLTPLPVSFFAVIYIISLVVGESRAKQINILQQFVCEKVLLFSGYSELIRMVENANHKALLLNEIQSAFSKNGLRASTIISRLSRHMRDLDQRTGIIRLLLNPFLLWDIRKAIAIDEWKEKNAAFLEDWIKALGQYDALCSAGIFTYTHPDYIFPDIADSYFEINGEGLGHPLLRRNVCIKNDINLSAIPYFLIVTGANMAGKSTYLRTIGINYVMACTGLPVWAKTLTVYPAALMTSLRTSDSLSDNESYFFSELKRLKSIIDRLNAGEKLFIILDEILKGTNSVDKQKGSLAFMRQLVTLRTCGIIATHDLMLGSLEEAFPENIRNMHFDADIINDELKFSYQLRPGIAQNMNACFLMNKMGIIVEN